MWNSIFGKTLRWIIFLPVSLFVLALAEYLIFLIIGWVFSWDTKTLIIIFIVFGGSIFLTLLFWIASLTAKLVSYLAPDKKIGTSILGIFYTISSLVNLYIYFQTSHLIFVIAKVLITIIVI